MTSKKKRRNKYVGLFYAFKAAISLKLTFIYNMFYRSLMVTTKQKARVDKTEKQNIPLVYKENHQFIGVNREKRNNENMTNLTTMTNMALTSPYKSINMLMSEFFNQKAVAG